MTLDLARIAADLDAEGWALTDPLLTPGDDYRVQMRHVVSRVRSGHRMTLGLIFHDAI